VGIREIRQRFLIVCEGEKTEPLYFESFRAPSMVVRIEGGESDPVRLVETAFDRWRQNQADYDQVWCVFDRDEIPAERFNRALELARQKKIRVAYSNPAFELWYALHFQECDGGRGRQEYCRLLDSHLSRPYDKLDKRIPEWLEPHTPAAITRAERLLFRYDPPRPADDVPSTTVHLLVRELRRYSRS
jgi:hypothetical protein